MKKALIILAVCSLLLTACGQIDDTESKAETTATAVSESTTDTETSSAKEENDTSEATTTTKKSSQTASSSSNPTGTTVTTTKISGSSNANGNSNQGQNNSVQNNNGQVNYQTEQNNQQPDNSPSDNDQSNNGVQQNNQPTDNKPQTTAAKPAVTNKPTTTTPKPQTTVSQTEPPAPEPDNQVVDINAVSDQMWTFLEMYPISYNELYSKGESFTGSEMDRALACMEYANQLGGRNCIEYALNAYFLFKGSGLECAIVFASNDGWYGHVENAVKIDGKWYDFDVWGQKYSDNLYIVVKAFDIYENEISVK